MTALLFAAVLVADEWKDFTRDFTRDPVALVRDGKDMGGSALLTERREGFKYYFTSEANREEFRRAPENYEIQLGGACGKMGPLSGLGSTKIYDVVNGRLYVFASEGCRATFRTGHERMLERDIVAPRPMKSAVDHGQVLADRMLAWSGGSKLGSIGLVKSMHAYDYQTATQTYKVTQEFAYSLPDRFMSNEDWDGSAFGYVVGGPNLFTSKGRFARPMAAQMVRSAERERNATYLRALYAVATKGALLIGSENSLAIYFDHSKVAFELGDKGEIKSLTMPRRHGMAFGEVTQTFTGFVEYKGVKLPTGWTTTFEGQLAPEVSGLKWVPAEASDFNPGK